MKQSLGKDLAGRLRIYSERMRAEGKKPGWDDLAAEIDAWVEEKKLREGKMKKSEANLVMEALAEALGMDKDRVPEARWARMGKCVAGIRAVQPDINPEMMKQAVENYRRIHPQWDCTENSIERYWDQLVPKARPTQAADDIPPDGWEQAFRELGAAKGVSGDTISLMIGYGWQRLSNAHRMAIRGHLARTQLPIRSRTNDE